MYKRLPDILEADADEGLDILFSYSEREHAFTDGEKSVLIQAIDNCKILDPACGSGAFPMGALHKLVFILQKLDPHNAQWMRRQIDKATEIDDVQAREASIDAIKRAFADNELDYGRKLYLIENCLYGVDIQSIAIQITKLRCFISLVCDQRANLNKAKNYGIRPLPNLETKFAAANTLISLPRQQGSEQLGLDSSPDYSETRERTRKTCAIVTSLQQLEVRNYHCRRKDKEIREKLVLELRKGIFNDDSVARRLVAWKPYDATSVADFFDPKWMFGKGLDDGFDVVIGNPPYVLLQNTQIDSDHRTSLIEQYVVAQYKIDLYHLFIEAGLSTLTKEGILAYITPNTFLKNKHTNRLRELIVTTAKIKSVVLFYSRVFQDSSVDNLIFICQNALNSNDTRSNTIMVSEIRKGDLDKELQASRPFPQASIKAPEYSFELNITKEDSQILAKIEKAGVPFGQIGGSYFGIQTFNRKSFVSTSKRTKSYRPAIDGGNVLRYNIIPYSEYVDFRPDAIKSGGDPRIYSKERIVVRQIGRYPEGALCPHGLLTLNTIYNLFLKDDRFDLRFVLAIINSSITRFYWLRRFFDNKETFPKIKKAPLHAIPIARCNSE